jgi:Cns1/TTC4 Wheel domain
MEAIETDDFWKECPLFAPSGVKIPVVPEEGSAENLSDALGALSHLIYDNESPEEVADELRDQGNGYFKRGGRDYLKLAIAKYSEAIAINCTVPETNAAAYSNRAAAQLKLKNFGKALEDAEGALGFQSNNVKARYRAAVSANALGKYDKAVAHCNAGLQALKTGNHQQVGDAALLRSEKRKAERELEREVSAARRRGANEESAASARRRLELALSKRNIKMGLPFYSLQRKYRVTAPGFQDANSDVLIWPVLIIYPDAQHHGSYEQSDYLEQVCEDATMDDIIATVLPPGAPPAPWDDSGMYCHLADSLEVRYRTAWTKTLDEADSDDEREFVGSSLGEMDMGEWRTISRSATLAQLLGRKDYVVPLFPVIYLGHPRLSH